MNNSLPIIYYQVKKMRDFWERSKSTEKAEFIKAFDETLLDIISKWQNGFYE